MGKISVIIPTYNRKDTIIRAIDSALSQTVKPYEILVCDDGSTDGTEALVKQIKDKRIKWIPGKHTGFPAVVRNKAIKKSQGEWLAFLDSDDEWFPEKLEKQLELAKNTGCLAVCCNAYSLSSKGEKRKYLSYNNKRINFDDLLTNNYVILSSIIFHRSLISKCYGLPENPRLKVAPDYSLWLRMSTQTDFSYLDEILLNYYDEPSISIRRLTKNPYLEKVFIFQDFLSWSIRSNISLKYTIQAFYYYLKSIKNLVPILR